EAAILGRLGHEVHVAADVVREGAVDRRVLGPDGGPVRELDLDGRAWRVERGLVDEPGASLEEARPPPRSLRARHDPVGVVDQRPGAIAGEPARADLDALE